jgi:hypothetical protein
MTISSPENNVAKIAYQVKNDHFTVIPLDNRSFPNPNQ